MVFAVVAATFLSTLAGGIVALRSTTQLGLIIALGAGVRIGAAFFDLAPESAREMGAIDSAMLFAGIGFLAFYLLERITLLHVGHEAGHPVERHSCCSTTCFSVSGSVVDEPLYVHATAPSMTAVTT